MGMQIKSLKVYLFQFLVVNFLSYTISRKPLAAGRLFGISFALTIS